LIKLANTYARLYSYLFGFGVEFYYIIHFGEVQSYVTSQGRVVVCSLSIADLQAPFVFVALLDDVLQLGARNNLNNVVCMLLLGVLTLLFEVWEQQVDVLLEDVLLVHQLVHTL
jgi:hypothetical protein